MMIVSACLCGVNCKYNGGSNLHPFFRQLLRQGELIPICPEQLGGLPTPRTVCEISAGKGLDVIEGRARVYTRDGCDVTDNLLKGAREVLQIAINCGADSAILKSRSPSCGHGQIYDGSFSGKLVIGDGVSAAWLKKNGIIVWSDQEYLKDKGVCTGIESS